MFPFNNLALYNMLFGGGQMGLFSNLFGNQQQYGGFQGLSGVLGSPQFNLSSWQPQNSVMGGLSGLTPSGYGNVNNGNVTGPAGGQVLQTLPPNAVSPAGSMGYGLSQQGNNPTTGANFFSAMQQPGNYPLMQQGALSVPGIMR